MRNAITLAALALVAACGGDDSDDGSEGGGGGGGGGTPDCADVWVEGKTLPADYEGCMNDGALEASVTYDCKDGSTFTGFDDRFYALLGGTVQSIDGPDDKDYAKAYNDCLG